MHPLAFLHHSQVFLETSCRSSYLVIIHIGEEKMNISLYNIIFPKQQTNNIRFSIIARDLFNSSISSMPEALILKHFIIRKVLKRKKEKRKMLCITANKSCLNLNSHFQSWSHFKSSFSNSIIMLPTILSTE